jgi:hypothetical protein
LLECIKLIDIQDYDDNGLYFLAVTELLNEENLELFAANPQAFKGRGPDDEEVKEIVNDEQAALEKKPMIEAMIAEQKKPISLQMDRDSFNELESMEQLRFLLKASGLPIISNLVKSKGFRELSTFIGVIKSFYFSEPRLNLITQNCYDKLLEYIKLIDTQDEEDGLYALAETGLLTEENLELLAANPKAFKEVSDVDEEEKSENDNPVSAIMNAKVDDEDELDQKELDAKQSHEPYAQPVKSVKIEPPKESVAKSANVEEKARATKESPTILANSKELKSNYATAQSVNMGVSYKSQSVANANQSQIVIKEHIKGIRSAEKDLSEIELKRQFTKKHKALFKRQKSQLGGWYRNSMYFNKDEKDLVYPDTLREILAHAKAYNNRSRQVCIQLGWLNKNGELNDESPEVIKEQYSGNIPHNKGGRM